MPDTINNREASATIRGYIYQFDATIMKILASEYGVLCTVEDVEDFDIHSPESSSYYQCKYYAAQKLTASVLRDVVLPMLEHYLSLELHERTNKRYHLYGYFKESSYEDINITYEDLKTILVRRVKLTNEAGETSYQSINIQDEIGASDDDLNSFVSQFSLELCSEYNEHKKGVIAELKSALNVSQLEAESYIYPSALTLVSALACQKRVQDRMITKETFLKEIRPNLALYSFWFLREKKKLAYCREIRAKYFTRINIDPIARFFIIKLPENTSDANILEILLAIRKKWSSHMNRRKPNSDRYAPYVFIRNLAPNHLADIKTRLHQDGYVFVDGYPFQGSMFSIQSICQDQTYQNKISIRFLNSKDDLMNCLAQINQPRSIYQFFTERPLSIEGDVAQVCIPITSASMIPEIV